MSTDAAVFPGFKWWREAVCAEETVSQTRSLGERDASEGEEGGGVVGGRRYGLCLRSIPVDGLWVCVSMDGRGQVGEEDEREM
jgi:hypothetical protein